VTTVRTRIAPSPTGFFHIGNAKTALYNWLLARQSGGVFILRLEDTDIQRSKEEYARVVAAALTWLGIDWDEGPGFEGEPDKGDCGPYRQSQRRAIYWREAQRLLDKGTAYKCFCPKEELDLEGVEKRLPRYKCKCRNLTTEEVAAKGDAPYAVRFKVSEGVTEIDDLVQGVVRVENNEFDDFIIVKPNGDPVFHLAVVVDDGLMKVTHVIRGDDHLTNAARHVMLFNALGYDLPKFAHHPLVHDEHGRKYSKRMHGANVLDWREDGYLRQELIEAFSIDRLSQSAARLDLKKLQWLNGRHIRMLPVEELRDRVLPIMKQAGLDVGSRSKEWLTRMTAICQEKIGTLNDIVSLTNFFFSEPVQYEETAVAKHWKKEGALERMETLLDTMRNLEPWSVGAIKGAYESLAEETGLGLGKFIHPTRLALTGKSVGPGLFELAELLSKETCVARMERAIEFMTKQA